MNLKDNRKLWESRVKEYRQSQMTAREWCQKQGLTDSALSYWITKLNKEQKSPLSQTDIQTTSWLSVNFMHEEKKGKQTSINVKIGPASIELKQGFDQKLLVDIVEALKSLC